MASTRLYINNLSQTTWIKAPEKVYADFSSVAVWKASVSQLKPHLQNLQALLSVPETEKALRYKQENDRNQHVLSKAVLRILLSRYTGIDPKEIRFKADQNKKPCLENAFSGQLHFNVSHSGNCILVAIADTPVGIDVEKINASFTYQNMLNFSFNQEEADFIENSAHPIQSFYQLWTRKECLLKATGKGLVDDLTAIPGLDGIHPNPETIIQSAENWEITSFKVDENHVGSVSFNPVKTALQFFNFQL
ncbi:4'-phosphopantetheinyl transferase family protein [Mucilaginibacter arboris]|uniref:4'-phosphopantetheinyl transferase superfamily protein n=1 Tax=Mucilaginibacter arboris TaxID=2682090 RepID=A0A7K1SYR5_9SPHI|nr:4'-phosphopantetheinyl transferase superfamily protein [Mucilaginibacter arboris]MVN22466.1 4'-phosphopantetheinyl transferase superfamily protein [Mucilaginibacter arboris]